MIYNTNKLKIAVTGLYRNCEDFVEENLHYINELKKHFGSVSFFAAENNSIDNTFKELNKFTNNLDGAIYKIDDLDSRFSQRTERLAYLHNFLINQIKDVDYIITVDSDGILKNFDLDGLLSCFNYDWNQWDMMGANTNEKYYDVWALRNKDIDFDCWDMVYHKTQMGMNRNDAIKEFVSKHQKQIPSNSDLIKVNSCFGGLGVYKYQSIANCFREGQKFMCDCKRHKVKGNCISEVCEHVTFHQQMIKKNNAKLFINPRLIVECPIEHLQ